MQSAVGCFNIDVSRNETFGHLRNCSLTHLFAAGSDWSCLLFGAGQVVMHIKNYTENSEREIKMSNPNNEFNGAIKLTVKLQSQDLMDSWPLSVVTIFFQCFFQHMDDKQHAVGHRGALVFHFYVSILQEQTWLSLVCLSCLFVATGHLYLCRFLSRALIIFEFSSCVCVYVCVLHKAAVHVVIIKSFPWLSQVELRASQTHPLCTCHSLSMLSVSICVHSTLAFFCSYLWTTLFFCFAALFVYSLPHAQALSLSDSTCFYLTSAPFWLFLSTVCHYK